MNYLSELTETARGVVQRYIDKGTILTSPEERQRRIAICEACPHFYFKDERRCDLCGCWMDRKICFEASYCKDGRWEL